jgi:oligopeptide transport system permease protein
MNPRDAQPEASASSPPRWWARLRRNVSFFVAGGALVLLVAVVSIGPLVSPYGESQQDLLNSYAGPGAAHWLGTDSLGRDLLTRVLYGGRISLAVGFVGALVGLLIGVAVGGVAGLSGGWIEQSIMRFIDFLYGIPLMLVVIALMVVLGTGLANVFIALGLLYWLGMARVVRARVAELRSREFVDAARVLGAGPTRILLRHILPNATGVIVVTATFMVPQAIFAESFLSFLGLGVTLPHASWGTLAEEGLNAMRSYPHVLAYPALAICLTMFVFQTLGEALRAALDPRQGRWD